MKISPRCPYCLLSRVHYQCQLSTNDPAVTEKAIKECLAVLSQEYQPGRTSTDIATAVHRKCYQVLNDSDPYRYVKKANNETALEIFPSVLKLIYGEDENKNAYTLENSPLSLENIFENAVLAAVIGNYFDFGVMGHDATDEDFKKEFAAHFEKGLDINDTSDILKRLKNVVYLVDNCGEIIFDREVLKIIRHIQKTQQLQYSESEKLKTENGKEHGKENGKEHGKENELILVVRGEPILTDVTMEEVEEFGLDAYVDQVLTTGTNTVGISLREAPKETLNAMNNATIIISKGMANYESLSDENVGPIAFLLRTKCEAVAESLGIDMGMSVVKFSNAEKD
ncbi:MAG: ARMT1-like domain-containing protein [Methanimicrococcus sp.]|nr:ARMT1-like domain-containing protein [Methanimicrococcus sp.]